jgi:hypothetical protein
MPEIYTSVRKCIHSKAERTYIRIANASEPRRSINVKPERRLQHCWLGVLIEAAPSLINLMM